MKLKELELLHHLTRFSSVSDAARSLYMTQPNASKMLKKIEERFGFNLFERINGRLRPTAEGRLIAEQAESTLMSLRRFEARTRNVRDMRLGSLTLGAMPLLSRNWLPKLLAEFMLQYPEVNTNLHTRSSRKLIELVAERQLDLAVAMLAIDDPLVECSKLSDLEMVAALHHRHPLSQKRELHVSDLHRQDFISSSMLDRSREHVETYFQGHNVVPNERSECSLPGAALQLVEQNIGITLVDRMTASEHNSDLVAFRPIRPTIHISLWVMRPRMRPKSRLVDSFEKLILSHALNGSLSNADAGASSQIHE